MPVLCSIADDRLIACITGAQMLHFCFRVAVPLCNVLVLGNL